MPCRQLPASDKCPALPQRAYEAANESTFCEYKHGIPCVQPQSRTKGCMRIQLRQKSFHRSPLEHHTGQFDLSMPAAPFGPALWHKSACSPCIAGANSYFFGSEYRLDSDSLHPRAYAQTTRLTDFFSRSGCCQKLSGNSPRSHCVALGIVGPFWA